MKKTKDIDGKLIDKVFIIAQLEDGQAIVACPTRIGEIDKEDTTLNDIIIKLEPKDGEDPKLASPIIFVEDLKALVDKWIIEDLRDYRDLDIIKFLEEKFK